jgi:hypothetical protein
LLHDGHCSSYTGNPPSVPLFYHDRPVDRGNPGLRFKEEQKIWVIMTPCSPEKNRFRTELYIRPFRVTQRME